MRPPILLALVGLIGCAPGVNVVPVETFAQVEPGMTAAEVNRLLGPRAPGNNGPLGSFFCDFYNVESGDGLVSGEIWYTRDLIVRSARIDQYACVVF